MKSCYCLAVLFCLFVASSGWSQIWELRGAYEADYPKGTLWRGRADGGEIKLVHWWQPSGFGIALAGGSVRWKVRDYTIIDAGSYSDSLSGEATYFPLGLSALLQAALAENPGFITTFEAGFRYMQCDGDMRLTRRSEIPGEPTRIETYPLTCDDGIVGRIAAGVEVIVREGRQPTTFFANLGYQFDLSKGKAFNEGWPRFEQELSLDATFIQLGFAIPLQ